MTASSDPNSARARLENALAILDASQPRSVDEARRQLALAREALVAARAAIVELEGELELVTDPERNAAAELAALRVELAAQRARAEALQVERDAARLDAHVEEQVHADERRRLSELERKNAEVNRMLMKDDDAFARFMDSALDKDDGTRREP